MRSSIGAWAPNRLRQFESRVFPRGHCRAPSPAAQPSNVHRYDQARQMVTQERLTRSSGAHAAPQTRSCRLQKTGDYVSIMTGSNETPRPPARSDFLTDSCQLPQAMLQPILTLTFQSASARDVEELWRPNADRATVFPLHDNVFRRGDTAAFRRQCGAYATAWGAARPA